jgi:phage/plasmid-like protein (TIGR03299 family)
MSRETFEWLNQNVLIGFADKRGDAWHYRKSDQGAEPNHYPNAIPTADVIRRLFDWEAVAAEMGANLKGVLDSDADVWKAYPNRKMILRSDNLHDLGVFKEGYQIHQYRDWILNNVVTLLDGDMGIGSAGLLRNGAQAWVQVEQPETLSTPEGVSHRPFITACASHDGSLATTYKRGAQLVVCDNTLSAALSDRAQTFKIKRTRNSQFKAQQIRERLDIMLAETGDAFAAQVKALCETVVTERQLWAFLEETITTEGSSKAAMTTVDKKRGEIHKLWVSDPRVCTWRGTAFGVLQAMNTWTHHFAPIKKSGGREVSRQERNLSRAVTGEIDKLDNDTLTTLGKILAAA